MRASTPAAITFLVSSKQMLPQIPEKLIVVSNS